MAIESKRDLEDAKRRFLVWLERRLPGCSELEFNRFERPASSGFSNDTLLCDLRYKDADGVSLTRCLVVRIAPDDSVYRVFPHYDIPRQFDVMKALGKNSDVPVPPCLWKETDPSVLGQVFYVMEHVEGQVPSDNPPYQKQGFVREASEAQRRQLWNSGLEVLAKVHAFDWRHKGLDFLAWPDASRSAIEQHLDYYQAYLEWAACGRAQPVCEQALAWLRKNMPRAERDCLSWGDARIGNQIFKDFSVVATLDWEMAAVGSPDMDLGWWLFVDEVVSRGNDDPEQNAHGGHLSGMPTEDESVAYYERCSGHEIKNLHYYKIFAGLRFGCVMIRIMQGQVLLGNIPEEYGHQLEQDNVVTQLTAELLAQS